MACGSCGGARARTTVGADGQQRIVRAKRTKYVWTWIPSGGGETKTFDSENKARDWIKSGNPGSLMLNPAV